MNHLSLLEETLADIPDGFFENTLLIGCQHILPATSILMDCFIQKGLQVKDIFLIGKCYSTSKETYLELNKKNIYVCPSSIAFYSHESHHLIFKKNVSDFIRKIFSLFKLNEFKKIIVLDDGGELHFQMNQILPDGLNVYGVEQTSFGYNKLKNLKLKYNIVNVARSKAKLTWESALVAKSICKELHSYLISSKVRKILIFGNGAIGSAISKILNFSHEIVRYDLDFDKSDFKQNDLSALRGSNMILGCSGRNILPVLLKNNLLNSKIFLASASSYDLEFDGVFFRKKKPETTCCHTTVYTDQGILINSGFPVNFSGNLKDGIPIRHLQLTLALLLSGAAQQSHDSSPSKLVDMDYTAESKIINHYLGLLGERQATMA